MKIQYFILFILLMHIVIAITPQDNFDLKGFYNLTNVSDVYSNFFHGDGSNLTNVNESDPDYYLNLLSYLNETTFPWGVVSGNQSVTNWTNVTANYLQLDQTTPQSVINGQPNFQEGLISDPTGTFDFSTLAGVPAKFGIYNPIPDATGGGYNLVSYFTISDSTFEATVGGLAFGGLIDGLDSEDFLGASQAYGLNGYINVDNLAYVPSITLASLSSQVIGGSMTEVVTGIDIGMLSSGDGSSIGEAVGIKVGFNTADSGSIGNVYGLKFNDITAGSINNYAWYSGLGKVHFGDDVEMAGSLTGVTDLSLVGNTTGTEKLINGNFTGNANNWNLGTGWTYNTNLIRKDVAGTGTLTQTSANMNTSIIAGETYNLSFETTQQTVACILTINAGGVQVANTFFNNGNNSFSFKAINSNPLTIVPSTNCRIYIDTISLKRYAGFGNNLFSGDTYSEKFIASQFDFQTQTLTETSPTTKFKIENNGNVNNTGEITTSNLKAVSNVYNTKISNGASFTSGTNWTAGTGWTFTTGRARKSADGMGNLTQNSSQMFSPLIAGEYYTLAYNLIVTNHSVIITIGGINITARNTSGTYIQTFKALNTNTIVIMPNDTLARFSISTLSLKKVDGIISGGSLELTGNNSVMITEGAGTRLMWVPDKASFRSGKVTGKQWDYTNIGANSFASGLDNTASGENSFAVGNGNTANDTQAIAIGWLNNAIYSNAIALGYNNRITGNGGITIGFTNNVSNTVSVAIGNSLVNSGERSLIVGNNCTNTNSFSFTACFNKNSTQQPQFAVINDTTHIINLNATGNISITGNTTPAYFIGDGSKLTGIVSGGDNTTFNETLTNSLYYNKSNIWSYYNSSLFPWGTITGNVSAPVSNQFNETLRFYNSGSFASEHHLMSTAVAGSDNATIFYSGNIKLIAYTVGTHGHCTVPYNFTVKVNGITKGVNLTYVDGSNSGYIAFNPYVPFNFGDNISLYTGAGTCGTLPQELTGTVVIGS